MNKVILLGRLVADPETRYTQSNIAMSRFRIAVNRPGKPQEGQPSADFIQITAWRHTAEFVAKYFHKGQQVLIEGYIRNNNWTDKDGNKRYSDEVHAEQVYFADSKRDSASNNVYGASGPQVSAPSFQGQKPENGDGFYALNEDDEDLPF
ncbi:MAG: single-stranded DNA-binding protein [Acetivibrionales bacterium]|jgi:single-strand DNA-binding protein|nr:single-stranded DNA-binding protein [Clostridiaceae bacterium]